MKLLEGQGERYPTRPATESTYQVEWSCSRRAAEMEVPEGAVLCELCVDVGVRPTGSSRSTLYIIPANVQKKII